MPRTGSTMIKTTLDTHRDITCLNAIFTPRGWSNWREAAVRYPNNLVSRQMASLPPSWDDVDRRIADMALLHETIMELFPESSRIGFKHHMGPIDRSATAGVIALKLPTIIVTRSNALAVFSSEMIAKATGQGVLRSGQSKRHAKVHFDTQEFAYFIPWWDSVYLHWEAEVRKTGVRYLKIDYVDARTREGMEQIVSFLKLDPASLGQMPTLKRNSDSMLDRFSNPEEVEAYLRENDLEHWLTEE
jgi:hypothetical protein